ncbi:MAG TPA: ChbG/HpnK family deacetylase, partial [Acidimicrobiales bacterium]
EFFDVYLDLAVEFDLPIRLSGASTERLVGFPFRQLAADEGVLFPDHFAWVPGVGSRDLFERVARDLRPGVTEILVHPAVDTPELRAAMPDWESRVDDHRLITADTALASALDEAGVHRLGYRRLHELQRAARVGAA